MAGVQIWRGFKNALTASYPDVSLLKKKNGGAREEGNATEGSPRLYFLPVVPRASRSSPVVRPSRSSRETPEEEADALYYALTGVHYGS